MHRFKQKTANRDADSVKTVAAARPAERIMVQVVDVSQSFAVNPMIAVAIAKFARLDVIVNNASVYEAGEPADISDERWQAFADANGVFLGCRAAISYLEKTRGVIINASVSGTGGDWGMSPYNAAKGAVVNLTGPCRSISSKRGIRVNSVCPSLTRTGMIEDMLKDEKRLRSSRSASGSAWSTNRREWLPSSPFRRARAPVS
ncbi:SDR family NAD(P)-dependent oxidoreductase [Rhizobium sp. RCC_161_2]|uniref:SDR family NAD(P)-dependent oxidoreductase n=1 Tax=Rhizobium sp. RCC_161_2 TaxID=3239219 RepID=UPI003524C7B5